MTGGWDDASAPGSGAPPGAAGVEDAGWAVEALEALDAWGRSVQNDLPAGSGAVELFRLTRPILNRICDFDAMALLLPDEDGLLFELAVADPPDARAALNAELEHQVAEGTFAWCLFQDRAVVVPGQEADRHVVFHVLSSPDRIVGMLLGTLHPGREAIPEHTQRILSILLLHLTQVAETQRLNRELEEHNRTLEERVADRTLELARSREEALAASRAKTEFLANMSHEIRTPVNGIMGMAELLADGATDPGQQEQLRIIRSSADSLLAILNDILDSARVESGRMELEHVPFDLHELVFDVAELLASRAQARGVDLSVHYPPEAPRHATGDPGRVRQILVNLVGNAVKFTEEGYVEVRVSARGEDLCLTVEDTGPGISPDRLPRIFEKFTQADSSMTRKYGGTGLGLAITRDLAELMGGRVAVESRPGEGSRFTVVLPLLGGAPAGGPSEGVGGLIRNRPRAHPEALPGVARRPGPGLVPAPDGRGAPEPTRDAREEPGREVYLCAPALEPSVRRFREMLEGMGHRVAVLPAAQVEGRLASRRGSSGPAPVVILPVSPGLETLVLDVLSRLRNDVQVGLLAAAPDRGLAERWARTAGRGVVLPLPVRPSRIESLLSRPAQPASRDPRPERPALSARVLVAEDDPVNRIVAQRFLESLGCTVRLATDGAEAVAMILDDAFDLVLMDWHMPVMDGLQATAEIRDRLGPGAPPVVALTASAMPGDRERALAAGLSDYLTKPLQRNRLAEVVERWTRPGQWAAGEGDAPAGNAGAAGTAGWESDAGPDAAVFDVESALERLVQEELLVELLQLFAAQSRELSGGIETALAEGRLDAVGLLAHRLKGSAGNVGATAVLDCAARLEGSADLKDAHRCSALVGRLGQALVAFAHQSGRWLRNREAA